MIVSNKGGQWRCEGIGTRAVLASWRLAYQRPGEEQRRVVPSEPGQEAAGSTGDIAFENEDLLITWSAECSAGVVMLTGELQAKREIRLWQVVPLSWESDLSWLAELDQVTVFRNGFQSWTPTGAVPGRTVQRYPLVASFALMNHYVDSPYWGRKDGLISSHYIVLKKDNVALSAGFLTQRIGLGEWFLKNRGSPALEASLDYGGKKLGAGEHLTLETIRLQRGEPAGLLEAFADSCGAAMEAEVNPDLAPVGWCSWYELYTKVNAQDVIANLAEVASRPQLGIDVVQLDDGYQAAIGDWQILNGKFPDGLRPLAQRINEAGFKAGLWSAPFFVALGSQTARQHPDWLLRDQRGRPVDCGFNPSWWARAKSLDTTHPEALAWLREVFSAWVADGFDYFKIDFLFGALRHGQRYDPTLSPVEAYRLGVETIRAAIGRERFLLGCGAPLGPSVGLFDAMRISEDVKEEWDSRLFSFLSAGCANPSVRGAVGDDLTRAFLHRRWWLNDPDCLLVRDRNTKLNDDEIRLLVTTLGMTGGMLFLSDDLARLAPERLEAVEKVLPPSALNGEAPDLLEQTYPNRFVVAGAERRVVTEINWQDAPVSRALAPFDGIRFDFWAEQPLAESKITIPRHGVRTILETETREVPHLIGTNLQLVALADGRITDRYDSSTHTLHLSGRDLAREQGALWISVPAGYVLAAEPGNPAASPCTGWPQVLMVPVADKPPWEIQLRFSGRDQVD